MDGRSLRARRLRFGLTQVAVAAAARIHQPDVAAVEGGRRTSPELLRRIDDAISALLRPSAGLDDAARGRLRAILSSRGARDIRIFGSVARGTDQPGSDLDLIARFPEGFDLFDLMELEQEATEVFGTEVNVVSDDPRMPTALAKAKAEAVPL